MSSELVGGQRCDGGLANFVNRFSLALSEAGHRAVVLGPGDGETTGEGSRPVQTVRVTTTAADRCLDRLLLRRFNMTIGLLRLGESLARGVSAALAREPVDLVHYSHSGGIGRRRPRAVPTVVRLSTSTTLCRRAGGSDNQSRFAMWQQELLERRAMRSADGVYGPGRRAAEVVSAEIGRPVEVIESLFFVESTAGDDRVLVDRLGDADYLLFVGRLNVLKGVPTIAAVLAELLARHPGLRFAFAGREHAGYRGRTMAEHLLASAGPYRDRVVLLGELPHAQLYPIMARARAVVLPSLFDNFPNVGLEAMAHGRVVVATHGSSFEQMIVDGATGILSRPGDPAALLAAVERALALAPDAAAAIGDRAAAKVAEWRPERMLPRYLQYFSGVAAAFHRRRDTTSGAAGES